MPLDEASLKMFAILEVTKCSTTPAALFASPQLAPVAPLHWSRLLRRLQLAHHLQWLHATGKRKPLPSHYPYWKRHHKYPTSTRTATSRTISNAHERCTLKATRGDERRMLRVSVRYERERVRRRRTEEGSKKEADARRKARTPHRSSTLKIVVDVGGLSCERFYVRFCEVNASKF